MVNFKKIEDRIDNSYIKEVAKVKNENVMMRENYERMLKESNMEII